MYLKKLHGHFNDWDLALAAYNSGPGTLTRLLEDRADTKKLLGILRRNLQRRLRYVPAFLATMYILKYAEETWIYYSSCGNVLTLRRILYTLKARLL